MGDRWLVVLGAGEDQLPAYRVGRRLGYRLVGVDWRTDALGVALADRFLPITIRDAEAIADALGDLDVAGVISPASDTALPAVATLSRRYGTAAPPPLAVRASLDKGYFRTVVDRLGLPRYGHVEGADPDQLRALTAGLRYPLVVKPTDGSGSKGLALVSTPDELPPALAGVFPHSMDGRASVEEAITGSHWSAECFLIDGKIRFMALTERTLTPAPHMITISHLVGGDTDERLRTGLADQIGLVCAEIGLRDGPVNVDAVVDDTGTIYLVELGARLGGAGLPLLIGHAYGVDNVAAAIRYATGEPVEVAPTRSASALLRVLHAPHEGILAGHGDLAAVAALPEVCDVRLFVRAGQPVRRYTQAAHKLGYLVVAGPTRDRLPAAARRADDLLQLRITPHHPSERLSA